ncbi:MAG: ATP-binding cassette domain-containing protein [Polyangia bacterium]
MTQLSVEVSPPREQPLPPGTARPALPEPAALELLLAIAGLSPEPARVREALKESTALADAEPDPEAAPPSTESILIAAGAALGLRVLRLTRSLRELTERADESLPLLLALDRNELALYERRGSRLLVGEVTGAAPQPAERWLRARELAAHLGVSEDAPLPWLTAVPAAAVGELASTAAHGPEHGHEPGHGHEHDAGAEHAHPLSPQRRLLALLRTEAPDLWIILTYAAAIGLLTLTTPVAVQALVNQVAFGQLLQPVVVLTLLLLLGLGLSSGLRVLQSCAVELLQQRLFVRLAADLAHRLPRTAPAAAHGPELASRFLEIATVQKAAASLLLDGLAVALQALIGLVVLAFYHPVLLAFDAVLLACIAAILLGLGRGAVRTSIAESRAKYAVADLLQDLARRPLALRLGHGTTIVSERADGLLREYLTARRGHFRVLLRQVTASLALQALASAALLGAGGALVIAGQLTLGQLVAAELIVSAVVAGVAKFGKHLESYYDLLAAIDKIGHLVDLPLERADGELLPPGTVPTGLEVRLRGVAVGAPGSPERPPLLRDLELAVAAGERIAVFGAPGSGRSLLCELLAGLRPPLHGSLELDGRDTRGLRLAAVRSELALLRGGSGGLLAGPVTRTIAEFLRTAAPAASRFQMQRALTAARLWPEVAVLPQGLDTPLGSDGQALSDRQRSRLLVARALLLRPRLIVLDLPLDGGAGSAALDDVAPLLAPGAPWTVIVCAPPGLALPAAIARRFELRDGTLCPLASPLTNEVPR